MIQDSAKQVNACAILIESLRVLLNEVGDKFTVPIKSCEKLDDLRQMARRERAKVLAE